MYALSNRIQRPAGGVAAVSKPRAAALPQLPHRPAAASGLRVVAFREGDDRNDLKRGARNAKDKARNLQRQGRENLQRGQRDINRRLQDADFEGPAARNSPTVYGINTLALGLAAGLAASSPALAAGILFKPSFLASAASNVGLLIPLMRILSLGWSSAAVTNYVQGNGAIEDDLDSTLHKRLNASLSTFSIAQLALLGLLLTPLSGSVLRGYNGLDVLNVPGLLVLGLGVAAQLYVAGVNYARNSPEGYNPVADAKSWLNDAANVFTGVNGVMSGGYAFLTFSLLGAGLGYIVAPYPTLMGVFGSSASQAGPENIILWQLIGAGVSMIVAPATLSLKEAAAASILSDTRFKLLNIGLFTAGLGHLLVLYPRLGSSDTAGPLLPIILATWATAAALGGINLFQSRKA